jgi:hypothetical protein
VDAQPLTPDLPSLEGLEGLFPGGHPTSDELPSETAPLPDSCYADGDANSDFWSWMLLCGRDAKQDLATGCRLVCSDFKNFYSVSNLFKVGVGVAVVAPLANSNADNWVQERYREKVRGRRSDSISEGAKWFGEGYDVIPIYVGVSLLAWPFEDTALGRPCFEWGTRTLRAMIVGGPTSLGLQYALGAERPSDGPSHWTPGESWHGVAGHGFMGALPFLTAASMTDNWWFKAPLFAGSFATTWSRLNDDDHYLSQSLLGWWIAYLAVECVDQTERQRNIFISPEWTPAGTGVSVEVRY